MAKFNKKKSGDLPAISTASLPDIVFMLLFFFMVATVMRDSTLMVQNTLPAADQIQKLDKKDIKVVIEQVAAMPGQGVTSMFNFGQSFGILKGICSAMQLPMYFVRPAKWKKYFNLINTEKDASRTRTIEIFPYFSSQLSRKKDSNKADAILIASFYYETYNTEE